MFENCIGTAPHLIISSIAFRPSPARVADALLPAGALEEVD